MLIEHFTKTILYFKLWNPTIHIFLNFFLYFHHFLGSYQKKIGINQYKKYLGKSFIPTTSITINLF